MNTPKSFAEELKAAAEENAESNGFYFGANWTLTSNVVTGMADALKAQLLCNNGSCEGCKKMTNDALKAFEAAKGSK